jgi:hypothetical protein
VPGVAPTAGLTAFIGLRETEAWPRCQYRFANLERFIRQATHAEWAKAIFQLDFVYTLRYNIEQQEPLASLRLV